MSIISCMLSCNALLRRLVTRVFCRDLLQAVTRSDRKLWTLILSPILWMHNEYNRAMTRLDPTPLIHYKNYQASKLQCISNTLVIAQPYTAGTCKTRQMPKLHFSHYVALVWSCTWLTSILTLTIRLLHSYSAVCTI